MALLKQLFSLRRKNNKSTEEPSWRGFTFSEQQVRVLLYREQGRKLLFDSNAVQKLPPDSSPTTSRENSSQNFQPTSFLGTSLKETARSRRNSTSRLQLSESSVEQEQSQPVRRRSATQPPNKDELTVKQMNYVEISNGHKYQCNRPKNDVNSLGEMIFGSVAMTFKGTSLKVHTMGCSCTSTLNDNLGRSSCIVGEKKETKCSDGCNPKVVKRLMCTHVFCPPIRPTRQSTGTRSAPQTFVNSGVSVCDSNAPQSTSGSDLRTGSEMWSVDVPRIADNVEADSGYSGGDHSTYSSVSSGPPSYLQQLDTNSDNSSAENSYTYFTGASGNLSGTRRRWLRSINTSLEHWPYNWSAQPASSTGSHAGSMQYSSSGRFGTNSESISAGLSDSGRRNSSGTEDSFSNSNNYGKRIKLGLAVVIELTERQEKEMEMYLIEHMPLLEGMLWRLQDCVTKAYWRRASFLSMMVDGSTEAAHWLYDIVCPPASPHPLWSGTVTRSAINDTGWNAMNDGGRGLFRKLGEELLGFGAAPCKSADDAEEFVKELSLLTIALDTKQTNFFLSAVLTGVLSHHLSWVGAIADDADQRNATMFSTLPCSALWSQLGELHGSVGNPPNLAHTVIAAQNPQLYRQMVALLKVLTYFIRYSEIQRRSEIHIFDNKDKSNVGDILKSFESEYKCGPTLNNDSNRYDGKSSKLNADSKVVSDITEIEMKILSGDNISVGGKINKENKYGCSEKFLDDSKSFSHSDLFLNVSNTTLKSNSASVETLTEDYFLSLCSEIKNRTSTNLIDSKHIICDNNLSDVRVVVSCSGENKSELNICDTNFKVNDSKNKCDVANKKALSDSNVNSANDLQNTFNGDRKTNRSLKRTKSHAVCLNKSITDLEKMDIEENLTIYNQQNLKPIPTDDFQKINLSEHILNNFTVKTSTQNFKEFFLNSSIKNISFQPHLKDLITANEISATTEATSNLISKDNSVIFVLGENEQLVNIKKDGSTSFDEEKPENPIRTRKISRANIAPKTTNQKIQNECSRSQSLPPCNSESTSKKFHDRFCSNARKCAAVLSLQEYPQVVTHYLRNKSLEIPQMLSEKGLKLNRSISTDLGEISRLTTVGELRKCCCECTVLQTPSNATELESTCDIPLERQKMGILNKHKNFSDIQNLLKFTEKKFQISNPNVSKNTRNVTEKPMKSVNENVILINSSENTLKICSDIRPAENHPLMSKKCRTVSMMDQPYSSNSEDEDKNDLRFDAKEQKLSTVELSMPRSASTVCTARSPPVGYAQSLVRSGAPGPRYVPGAVLQATTEPVSAWRAALIRDLSLAMRHHVPLDQQVSDAVCILADLDTWNVQLVSGRSQSVNTFLSSQSNGHHGMPVGSSQLVADMLETVSQLWQLRTPTQHILQHIEYKLCEIYARSIALSEVLLSTDFCDMSLLTSTLGLHPNDVPLLLSVASTHSPQVTQKYGLSFQ